MNYFYYDENAYEMVGQHTGKTYKLGQTIKVMVERADKLDRTIDFIIPEEDEEPRHKKSVDDLNGMG